MMLKRIFLLLSATVAISAMGIAAPVAVNALAPHGSPVKMTLAVSRQPLGIIVLPSVPSPQETQAAEILKTGLDAMSGANFAIVREPDLSKDGIRLSIGKTNLFRDHHLQQPPMTPDGYSLQAVDGILFFNGGERRGPINAVIAFLEEDLGCRWYSRFMPASYPQQENLTVNVVPRTFSPRLEMRDVYMAEAWNPEWALLNRINSAVNPLVQKIPPGYGGMAHYPGVQLFVHTFATLAPDASLLKSHPEYFALIGGQRQTGNLCLSNPETVKLVAKKAIAILNRYPDSRFFSVSQNDGDNVLCRCKDCLALSQREGDAGLMIRFVNQVARLIQAKYPQVKVSTLAYQQTYMPPKTIRPDKNVLIWFATDRHVWANPYFYMTETKKFQTALKAWHDIGTEIHIWDYTFGDNNNWLKPAPNFDVIAHNYAFLIKHGISGIFFQDDFQSIGSSRGAMKAWVLAKLAWNPDWSMDDLVRDFTLGYYGAAGPVMQQYNHLLRQHWEVFHRTHRPDTQAVMDFPPEFLHKAQALLTQAKAAAGTNTALVGEIEREEACLLYVRLSNGMHSFQDKEAYARDMATLRQYIKRFGIKSFAEGAGADTDKFFLSWTAAMNLYGKPKRYPDAFPLTLADVMLPAVCGKATCHLIEDSSSDSGYAIYQPCPITHWSIQWNSPRACARDKTYVLQVKIKLGKLKHPGKVLHCGVWDPKQYKDLLPRRIVDSSELTADKFTWVTIGKVKPTDKCYVYAGPVENSAAEYFLVEAGELIPENEFKEVK